MLQSFDELYVISDLHLGGETGFQIFDQGKELAGLIDFLRGRPQPKRVGLVLNGDVVDFLAEPYAKYFDPVNVVNRLKRIAENEPAFLMVWEALKKFVNEDNRELVFVLGNHDVELSLPAAKEYLLERLCQNSAAARGRIVFATDGAGYACEVNHRKVLCVHGNEVDTWNLVDHHQLLGVSRALNRFNAVPEWTPNAGTKLVIDIMNEIKQTQPFVDLLKPEKKAVIPILLATENNIAQKLKQLAPVLLNLANDKARHRRGELIADEEAGQIPAINETDAMEELLHPRLRAQPVSARDDDKLFFRVEERYQQRGRRMDYKEESAEGVLGLPGMLLDRFLNRDPVENLGEALKEWLVDDHSFDADYEDGDTFIPLDQEIGEDIAFIVAGHTHLHRSLKRTKGPGFYFNSGTWIRLIKIPMNSLEKDAFRDFFQKLRVRTMKELDQSGLIIRCPTVVCIAANGDKAAGELRYMRLSPEPHLEPIGNTRREV